MEHPSHCCWQVCRPLLFAGQQEETQVAPGQNLLSAQGLSVGGPDFFFPHLQPVSPTHAYTAVSIALTPPSLCPHHIGAVLTLHQAELHHLPASLQLRY